MSTSAYSLEHPTMIGISASILGRFSCFNGAFNFSPTPSWLAVLSVPRNPLHGAQRARRVSWGVCWLQVRGFWDGSWPAGIAVRRLDVVATGSMAGFAVLGLGAHSIGYWASDWRHFGFGVGHF